MKKMIIALVLLILMISIGIGAGRLPMKGDNVTIMPIDDNLIIAYYGIINDTDEHLIVLDYSIVRLNGMDRIITLEENKTAVIGKSNIKLLTWRSQSGLL